jgi:predicted MPP superfamily phosphohydrolase
MEYSFFWFVVRLLTVTVGFAAVHGYVWWRLVRDTTAPRSRWRRLGTATLLTLLAFGLGARFALEPGVPERVQQIVGWPGQLWFGTFAYLFGLLVLAEPLRWWLLRRTARPSPEPSEVMVAAGGGSSAPTAPERSDVDLPDAELPDAAPTGPGSPGPTRRTVIARGIGAATGAGAALTAGYGVVEAHRTPRLKSVAIPMPKLDRAFDGYRIAVVGDVHLSALHGRDRCAQVVDVVNRARADLVAIVGDLASGEAEALRAASEPLAGIESRDGAFFVTGNAEHYVGADAWIDRVRDLGIEPLPNLRAELPGFDLAGVNDLIVEQRQLPGETGPDLAAALDDRDTERPVILLAHQPNVVQQAVDWGVDLQLSGHTHGGQMWPVHLLTAMRQVRVSGLGEYGGTRLYVTNGAGTNGPPMRVGAPADVTVVTLRSTQA